MEASVKKERDGVSYAVRGGIVSIGSHAVGRVIRSREWRRRDSAGIQAKYESDRVEDQNERF